MKRREDKPTIIKAREAILRNDDEGSDDDARGHEYAALSAIKGQHEQRGKALEADLEAKIGFVRCRREVRTAWEFRLRLKKFVDQFEAIVVATRRQLAMLVEEMRDMLKDKAPKEELVELSRRTREKESSTIDSSGEELTCNATFHLCCSTRMERHARMCPNCVLLPSLNKSASGVCLLKKKKEKKKRRRKKKTNKKKRDKPQFEKLL